jgi:hypothetical protein
MEATLAVAEKRVRELAASDREPPDEVLSTISV